MGGGGNAEQYNTPVSLPSTISSCWKFAVVYFRTRTLASCPLPQWKEGKKKKKKPQKNKKRQNKKKKKRTPKPHSLLKFFFLTSFFIFFLSEVSDFDVVHSLNLVGSLAGVIQQSSAFGASESTPRADRRATDSCPGWHGRT